ncbi:MAG: hypothetical protein KGJ86_03955 [Chloroflexota bacterium]|nr:hypothetical protein [Chloroflexota bacterium]
MGLVPRAGGVSGTGAEPHAPTASPPVHGAVPAVGKAAEASIRGAREPSTAAARGVVRTYSEVRLDATTHQLAFTVRDAASGKVLIAWPLRSLQQLAATREYVPGSLVRELA